MHHLNSLLRLCHQSARVKGTCHYIWLTYPFFILILEMMTLQFRETKSLAQQHTVKTEASAPLSKTEIFKIILVLEGDKDERRERCYSGQDTERHFPEEGREAASWKKWYLNCDFQDRQMNKTNTGSDRGPLLTEGGMQLKYKVIFHIASQKYGEETQCILGFHLRSSAAQSQEKQCRGGSSSKNEARR